jgi:hypothetical protein
MELKEAIQLAWNGRAVLFAGAGFSSTAINLRGETFKNGSQLAAHFAKKTGLPDSTGLEDAAEEFLTHHGSNAMMDELKQEFSAKQVSPSHVQIAKVPWRRIYTTNYDNVIETACSQSGRPVFSTTLSDDIRAAPKDRMLCVHLNGYIDRLSRDTVTAEIKLTDTSYLTATIVSSPWSTLFRQDLTSAQAVFFIGYSVWDLDIRRLLFEHEGLRNKSFFALGANPNPTIARRVIRFGTLLPDDTQEIAGQFAANANSAHDSAHAAPIPFNVQQYAVQPSGTKWEDRFIFELFLYGKLHDEFLWRSVHDNVRYCLFRSTLNIALTHIEAGRRVIILHSDLGNGKTVALEALKSIAASQHNNIYTIVNQSESLYEELEYALSTPGNKLFVIDNYPEALNVLEFFGTHQPEHTTLVLSARTAANDLLIDRAAELLRTGDIAELELDRLNTDELNWLSECFNEYGLWGNLAGWSQPRKIDYLQRICHAEWHAILIKLLESPHIQAKLEKLFEGLRGQNNYSDVITSILILAVLGYNPTPERLVDLCGHAVLESGFKRDPVIREIIDFDKNQISLKSSVAGQFILQRIVDPNATIKSMAALAKLTDKSAYASPYYFNILKSLMRHTNVQSLLPENSRGRATLAYYESIKELEHAKGNPLFWLQYAIACLVIEEFERAEKYFQTAYSFGKSRDYWDTFQIDNHYARFLLTRAISLNDISTCMTAFRSARAIIHNQIERERLHYPYRVASLYSDFYARFASRLKMQNKDEIKRAAKHVCERIEKLPPIRQEHPDIRDCFAKLERVLRD